MATEQNKSKTAAQFIMKDEQSGMIAKIMRKRIDTFNIPRRTNLLEIKANISYLIGEQNIKLLGGQILPLEKERAIESSANVILPAVQKDIAVGTTISPSFDIVPAGTDDDDKATAIIGMKIYKYLQRKIGKDLKRGEAILWYDISGVGWRKVYYDPDYAVLGVNPPPVDENNQPVNSHIPSIPVGDAITEGEVVIDCIPTNQLIYDFRVSDLRKLDWIIHAKRVTQQWVVDTFGLEVTNKLISKFNTAGTSCESQFEANVMGTFGSMFGPSVDQIQGQSKMSSTAHMQLDTDKQIDYYEYWAKPTKSNPTGNFAVMLGDQVVAHSPYPTENYPHGELPFIAVAPMSIEGRISRISQARPLQREYNRLRSQILENIDIMGNSVILAPRQAKLRYRTLDNGAGNVIEYDGPVGKPDRQSGVPMNSQIFLHLNETKLAIDGIFAFHEPSRGIAPRNIESGKGLQQLESADIKHLGPIIGAFEEGDERVLYQALILATANYPDGKMINVVGTDYEWTIYETDKEQLRGKFNVMVRQNSSMPLDKDKEGQNAFLLWQSGMLGDPMDPELRLWTLDQMHVGNYEALLQKHSKHRNFAKKEFINAANNIKDIFVPEGAPNDELAATIEQYLFIPPVNQFDDHMVHIHVHNEYLLDNYWNFRATRNPLYFDLLDRMLMHLTQHQLIVSEVQQRQFETNLRAQMLIKGKTPEQIALAKKSSGETKGK